MFRLLGCLLVLGACTDPRAEDAFFFSFDDRKLLCGFPIDDYLIPTDWDHLQQQIDVAVEQKWIVNVYAHAPGVTIQVSTLERALSMFAAAGLPFVTYPELDATAVPYAGVAFQFDDDSIDAWTAARPLLDRYAARVTLFVTRFDELSADQRAALHALAADGHAVESHSVSHVEAARYAAELGAHAYLDDEVLPSLAALRADGFTPESFAYPYGSHTEETDELIAPHVRFMRTTPGGCDR
jgi:hypothetical protein